MPSPPFPPPPADYFDFRPIIAFTISFDTTAIFAISLADD
jgi:hypothetical protein